MSVTSNHHSSVRLPLLQLRLMPAQCLWPRSRLFIVVVFSSGNSYWLHPLLFVFAVFFSVTQWVCWLRWERVHTLACLLRRCTPIQRTASCLLFPSVLHHLLCLMFVCAISLLPPVSSLFCLFSCEQCLTVVNPDEQWPESTFWIYSCKWRTYNNIFLKQPENFHVQYVYMYT